MARLFTRAQKEFLQIESAAVLAAPFSILARVNTNSVTVNQSIFWLGDKDVANDYWLIVLVGTLGGDPFRMRAYDGTAADADTANAFTADSWHTCVGRAYAADDRDGVLNADFGNKGTSAVEKTPDNADRMAIGATRNSNPTNHFSGAICEVALYNKAVSNDLVLAYHAGCEPLRFLDGLTSYWPLGGLHGNHDRDIIGGYDMTAFSDGAGPGWTDHPPVLYQTGPRILRPLWEPLGYSVIRSEYVTTVTVTSDRPPTVYYHWYVDGVFIASTRSPTRSFRLSQSEQVRIEVRATRNPYYDPLSDPPVAWPARRSLWWVRSTDSTVSYYRVEEKLGAGDWETLRIVPQVADQWAYSLLTDRLDDLSSYTWRVIPVDAAGNDGTPITIGAELIVRTPDAPDFTATFDSGTTKVTFDEA